MKRNVFALISILLAIGIISGCAFFSDNSSLTEKTPNANPVTEDKPEEIKQAVTIYFASDNHATLTAEKRTVTAESKDALYKKTIEELIKGPLTDSCSPAVNSATVINNVTVTGKTAYADFASSLTEYNTGGSTRELLCLYSIVNTLCEFNEIENVIITIDGKSISTFGQIDMSEAFTTNEALIK